MVRILPSPSSVTLYTFNSFIDIWLKPKYMGRISLEDFILGFDVLDSLKRVPWHLKELKNKNHLSPWTTISHLYPHGDFESYPNRNFQDIMCCFSLKIPYRMSFTSLEKSRLLLIFALQEEWRHQTKKRQATHAWIHITTILHLKKLINYWKKISLSFLCQQKSKAYSRKTETGHQLSTTK